MSGDAHLEGCEEWFKASLIPTKDGRLVLTPHKGGPAKCRAVFRPVR